jgi:hypothetical protein
MEISMEVPQEEGRTLILSSHTTSEYIPKRIKASLLERNLCTFTEALFINQTGTSLGAKQWIKKI